MSLNSWDIENNHNYHPMLHLLAIERTGWRRWLMGRWVYSSEPFRRDIQRRCANTRIESLICKGETYGPEWEAAMGWENEQ